MLPGAIESLLKDAIGLNVETIGEPAVRFALKSRQQACGLKDEEAYLERLHTSADELQQLIEAVVVPETWFFRNREAFAALVAEVMQVWLPAHPNQPLRVLSLPCATGEEPYSIAMALLDAGFPPQHLHIDGMDVSHRSLERAREARYGQNAFRGKDLGFRDSHFAQDGAHYRLSARIRERVHFSHGNLIDASTWATAEAYDYIFCRNVLIYLDADHQQRCIGTLTRLLKNDGLLFVGPSEGNLLLQRGFFPVEMAAVFAFHKDRRQEARPDAVVRAARWPLAGAKPVRSRPAPMPAPSTPTPAVDELALAQTLADRGQLDEALVHCEAHIRAHGPSAEACYLKAVAHDARGEAGAAERFYRQALYLNPTHQASLLQLALLLETQGDDGLARQFRQRADRLADKEARR